MLANDRAIPSALEKNKAETEYFKRRSHCDI